METKFIKVKRIEHGDEMVIPIEVHLKYPELYPAVKEEIPVVIAEPEVVEEAVEAPVKIKKGPKK